MKLGTIPSWPRPAVPLGKALSKQPKVAPRDQFIPSAASLPLLPKPAVAPRETAYDPANLDTTVRPQDDFFQYAVGGFLAKNPIPDDKASWGVDAILNAQTQEKLKGILEGLGGQENPHGSNEQKLADFYKSGMNTSAIEGAGLSPLQAEFARIDSMRDMNDLQDEIARLHGSGFRAVFDFDAMSDFKNPEKVIGVAAQGGLGMPDRDYYLKNDEATRGIRAAYVNHVTNMFTLLGNDPLSARVSAQTVMLIETRLAAPALTKVQLRDTQAIYHPMDKSELKELTPNFSWDRYFTNLGRPDVDKINMATPKFFTKLNDTLQAVPVQDWKTYLKWQVLSQTAPYLPQAFEDESFNFNGKVLMGVPQNQPRWKRIVRSTDENLGEALGQKFVQQNFPPQAKAKALEMVENVKTVLRKKIQGGWMSDDTKKEAQAKVDTLVSKIGYPDKWKDYSGLSVDNGVYADNVLRARRFDRQNQLATIDKPVDRSKWLMTPSTVNAYYDPSTNEIVFPAAILQPPYFDVNADDAANYGATGATIGHELTHGFDDQGSQFDAHGNLRNWWQPADLAHFQKLADGVEHQFDEFVYDGQRVVGKLVEGESIADLGGLELAYDAFQHSAAKNTAPRRDQQFSPEQRFFLNYALSWGTQLRPEYGHYIVSTNEHPLPKFRVLGPLANLPAFHQAFDCQPGDPMVRPPEKRNRLWNSP